MSASSAAAHAARIVVDGVELTVTQKKQSVTIKKIVARDRKRKLNVTSGVTFNFLDTHDPPALNLLDELKKVAQLKTAPCTCDYRYGFSDHADHCRSLYVARSDGACFDDD